MRILACADLQLGAGAGYLEPKYGPGSRLYDHEQAWLDCVSLAAQHKCDAIIVAGDVFEEKRPGPTALLAFQHGLDLARSLRIQVVIIAGNHDVRAADEAAAIEVFQDVEHGRVMVHRTPTWDHFAGGRVAYAVLPWTTMGGLAALRDGGDRDLLHAEAGELLVQAAAGLRQEIRNVGHDGPAVLIAHWAVSGASLPSGVLADELREVVIPTDALAAQGWDAIVLGHLHRQQWLTDGRCPAFYVGSPLPCDFGEAGYPHGAILLELDETPGAGATFLPIESRPFVTIDVRDPGAAADDVEDAIVRVVGKISEAESADLDRDLIRATLAANGAASVRVDVDVVRESRARVETLTTELGPVQALDAWIASQGTTADPDTLRRVHLGYLEQEHAA